MDPAAEPLKETARDGDEIKLEVSARRASRRNQAGGECTSSEQNLRAIQRERSSFDDVVI